MLLNEKKVPLRKVMGNNTKLLTVPMSLWDFARKDTSTPKKEKTKQESTRTAMKTRFMFSEMFIEDETRKPINRKAVDVNKPRTTPIRAFPMIIEYGLMGAIKHSSNDLKNRRSTLSFCPTPPKLTLMEVNAIIPGITNSR
jgi:hypothetical protein